MARLELSGLAHRYGDGPPVLHKMDHVFADGGAYALLGPSGCGKTTLLNIISGLVTPSEGRVLFDDQDMTNQSTDRRNIAQVFQFPVVYDTMTVAENLAFPLRNRRVPADEIGRRVKEVLDLLGLGARASERARRLTADDKQKISLGRALVRFDVNAILLDEPLTVIDPHLKWRLRSQLKALHRRFGHTMVYVTHDQTEALTFADQVVVMYEGEVVQIGTPTELFETPRHTFVGRFIGSPGMNFLPVRVSGAFAHLGPHAIQLSGRSAVQGNADLGIRPEYVRLGTHGLPATVTSVQDVGHTRLVKLMLAGHELIASLPEGAPLPEAPFIELPSERVAVFADSRRVALT